ncbi:hypothetical protein MCP1_50171 [Candidatus Terasakiella magnetica]|nr:hypothetical protein MCP1_50171 [Candidatus Terasakiella magnetica]
MIPSPAGHDLELLAQARLAARAAHHFNNCLAVIIANLEMALEDWGAGRPLDPALVELPLDAARRAAGTCRMLQNFSRPPGAPPSPVGLADVLRQVAEEYPNIEVDGSAEGITVLAEESEFLAALDTLAKRSGPFILERGRLAVLRPAATPDTIVLTLEGDSPPLSSVSPSQLLEPLAGHPAHDIDLSQAGSMMRRAGGEMVAAINEDGRLVVHLRLPVAPPINEERG